MFKFYKTYAKPSKNTPLVAAPRAKRGVPDPVGAGTPRFARGAATSFA